MRTPWHCCSAPVALGTLFLMLATVQMVYAQGKLPIPGSGGSGVFEITAPPGEMTAEGHAAPVVPVAYTNYAATAVLRGLRQDGAGRVAAVAYGAGELMNLALGKRPEEPQGRALKLVLQIGDDTPASVRLAVIDSQGGSPPVVVATGRRIDLIRAGLLARGLLQLQFQSVGLLRGGSVQLVCHTVATGSATVLTAGGNGQLEAAVAGTPESLLLNSVTLRAEVRTFAGLRQ